MIVGMHSNYIDVCFGQYLGIIVSNKGERGIYGIRICKVARINISLGTISTAVISHAIFCQVQRRLVEVRWVQPGSPVVLLANLSIERGDQVRTGTRNSRRFRCYGCSQIVLRE